MFVLVEGKHCLFLSVVYPNPWDVWEVIKKIQKDSGFCWMLDERKGSWTFQSHEASCQCKSIMAANWVTQKARLAILNHFMDTHIVILMAPLAWTRMISDLREYQ